jgi:hypothetical protein
MHIFGYSLSTILPTLFSIILLCVRVRSRKIVPLLSIIFNFALYDLMAKQLFAQAPAFKIPFKFSMYPYLCLAALFIGMLVEIIIRVAVKYVRNKMRSTDAPPISGGITMTDIATLYVVFCIFIGFIAPHTLSLLVLAVLVLLAARELRGLAPRWITVCFLVYGGYLIEVTCLSLVCNQTFQSCAGFQLAFESVKRIFTFQEWLNVLANMAFGAALYTLCKKIKEQITPPRELAKETAISATETSSFPGEVESSEGS